MIVDDHRYAARSLRRHVEARSPAAPLPPVSYVTRATNGATGSG